MSSTQRSTLGTCLTELTGELVSKDGILRARVGDLLPHAVETLSE